MDLEVEIKKFLESLPSQSQETKKAYGCDLKLFQQWMGEQGLKVEEIRPAHIRSYIFWLHNVRDNFKSGRSGLAPASVNRRIACLKSFIEYLIEMESYHQPNPIRKKHYLKIGERLPKPLEKQQADLLMSQISHVRDKALFLMYLESGLRLRELLRLDESQLQVVRHQHEGKEVLLGSVRVLGKGDKERIVYFPEKALRAYLQYLKQKPDGCEPLFVSRSGERMTAIGVQKRLEFWCGKLGLKGVHLHRLRHTYATRLVENGMRLEHLSELMGHSNINTTKKYVRVAPENVREAFMKSAFMGGSANEKGGILDERCAVAGNLLLSGT